MASAHPRPGRIFVFRPRSAAGFAIRRPRKLAVPEHPEIQKVPDRLLSARDESFRSVRSPSAVPPCFCGHAAALMRYYHISLN